MKNIYLDDDIEQSVVKINSVPNSSVNIESMTFDEEASFQSARSAQVLHKKSIFEGGKK